MKHPWGSGNLPICFILSPFAKVKQLAPRHRPVCRTPGWASSLCRHSASPVQLCVNASVPHRFLEFCKAGYTGCPFLPNWTCSRGRAPQDYVEQAQPLYLQVWLGQGGPEEGQR